MKRVLIVGATSAIAEAVARILAARGAALYLVARDSARVQSIAADLRVRGSPLTDGEAMDANDTAAHAAMLERAEARLGGLDTVLVAHGTLSDQEACQRSVSLAMQEIATNGLSVVALLTPVANRFEARRHGTIAVISSVAGDRGRQSNYVYGSAKALVTTFLSGLRQRLRKAGVNVITIKPGFVDTPMTAAFRKGALWANASQVAAGIVRAMDRNASVVYLPGFWRAIMFVIRCVPERIFIRLKL